jgi:hypothetical protein
VLNQVAAGHSTGQCVLVGVTCKGAGGQSLLQQRLNSGHVDVFDFVSELTLRGICACEQG